MSLKRTKELSECGMLIAAALALSQLKLIQMASGGSVSLSILPLLIIAARRGIKTGCLCGAAFGILRLATGPTVVHPLQFVLDYPLAYAAIGFAGLFNWASSKPNKNALKAAAATSLASFIRLHSHVAAGMFFFDYEKIAPLKLIMASYAYNLSYIVPETIICTIIAGVIAKGYPSLCERQPKA